MATSCALCSEIYGTSGKDSSHWCKECAKAMCQDCKTVHMTSESLKTHEIIPISEYNNLQVENPPQQSGIHEAGSSRYLPPRPLLQIGMKLKVRFPIDQSDCEGLVTTTGGAVLPDGRLLVCDHWNNREMFLYDEIGVFIRSFSKRAYEIALIDENRIAITSLNTITIFNLQTEKVEMKQQFESTSGCCYYNDKLYVCVQIRGIVVLDLQGQILDTIKVDTYSLKSIAVHKDKIYITDSGKNIVYCLAMDGTILWKFNNKWILEGPIGIAIDNYDHILVVGSKSDNLVALSNDGLQHNILLSKRDGLNNPVSLWYDKKRDEVLMSHTCAGVSVYHTYTKERSDPDPENPPTKNTSTKNEKASTCALL